MKILDVFERHPRISNVEFCNMSLTPAKLLPLFRSLQCHAELVKLALPGNRVGKKIEHPSANWIALLIFHLL